MKFAVVTSYANFFVSFDSLSLFFAKFGGVVEMLLKYRADNKKVNNRQFKHHRDYLEKKFFSNINNRQSTIFEQILKTFGQCQNCLYWTFKQPYKPYK